MQHLDEPENRQPSDANHVGAIEMSNFCYLVLNHLHSNAPETFTKLELVTHIIDAAYESIGKFSVPYRQITSLMNRNIYRLLVEASGDAIADLIVAHPTLPSNIQVRFNYDIGYSFFNEYGEPIVSFGNPSENAVPIENLKAYTDSGRNGFYTFKFKFNPERNTVSIDIIFLLDGEIEPKYYN
jgi:hypothetical protein